MKSAERVTGSSSRWAKSAPLGFCVVVLLTVVLYVPSLAGGFVWDDTALVLRDPLIRSWRLTNEAFDHFLFLDATASNFYRPLQRLSYISDYQWFGFAPWGYHLTSALTHALAAGALFLLARALIQRPKVLVSGEGIPAVRLHTQGDDFLPLSAGERPWFLGRQQHGKQRQQVPADRQHGHAQKSSAPPAGVPGLADGTRRGIGARFGMAAKRSGV